VTMQRESQEQSTNRLVTLKELEQLLQVSEATLHRLRSKGQIGPLPVRVGRLVRFSRAEVLAWLGSRQADGRLPDAKTWQALRGRR
jgi:excisionase family DNA binding protein